MDEIIPTLSTENQPVRGFEKHFTGTLTFHTTIITFHRKTAVAHIFSASLR